ncbi:MAG: dienelactone hydrolase family protein, partial [Candidatus Brocadiia bacterium]
MNIRHTLLLIVLLLLAAWSVAGGEDAKPTNVQTKKKIAEYIAADEAGREKLSAYFKGLPPLAKKDCAKWLAEIQNAAAAQLKKAVQKALGKDDETFAKAGVFNVEAAGAKMKYFFRTGGKRGANGYPLYINLHGGGDSAEVNESAWETAKGQYSVSGSLIVPRSTQDVALSWAVPEAWPLVDRLLYESFLLRDVDPDSVYLMGYSMGGWGTLLMAPAMADRWAACAASAGGEHVQRAFPENLRNTPIIIQIGTDDNAFQRYALSKAYADKLKELKAADPDGYKYEYKEHKGAAHQIDDSGNPKWLAQYTRDTYPKKIVWRP